MSNIVSPTLITALTSLTISLITLFQFYKNQISQQKQFDGSLNRQLTTKLYDLRLEYYPNAFEITDQIFKEKGGNFSNDKLTKIADELLEWKKGSVNLIISSEALASYYILRDSLMKNPGNNISYTAEQIDKITNSKNIFRKQLRRDLGFLFIEEKNKRS